jgi:hypothetical protein
MGIKNDKTEAGTNKKSSINDFISYGLEVFSENKEGDKHNGQS